jgi:hypothetical protein
MIYSIHDGCCFWDKEASVLGKPELGEILVGCLGKGDTILVGGGGTGLEVPTLAKARKMIDVRPDVIALSVCGQELAILWKALDSGVFAENRPILVFTYNTKAYRKYEPESFLKLLKALEVEGYGVNRLAHVIVCLSEEPDNEKRPAIHKLLHGGLQRASTKPPEAAKEVR